MTLYLFITLRWICILQIYLILFKNVFSKMKQQISEQLLSSKKITRQQINMPWQCKFVFLMHYRLCFSICLTMLNFVSTSKKTHFTVFTHEWLVFLMNSSDMGSQVVFYVESLGYLSYKSHFWGLFFSWTNDCVFPYA